MENADNSSATRAEFAVEDYNLETTLTSGQAFRWRPVEGGWESVLHGRWVRLRAAPRSILAETALPQRGWGWLEEYLQTGVRLSDVVSTFPKDAPLTAAVDGCRGLRLLRQDPWECLASFILSSTKRIIQIQQCIDLLCARLGTPVLRGSTAGSHFAFPDAAAVAAGDEALLRDCKMGFRAPYLLQAARTIDSGHLDLAALGELSTEMARERLMTLHGVGRKIADCVLLFAYGRQDAFPADVWILKALRRLYFPGRNPSPDKLHRFVATYFGPNAGYAQQYLFHYARVHLGSSLGKPTTTARKRITTPSTKTRRRQSGPVAP